MGRPTPLIPSPRTAIAVGDERRVRVGEQIGRGSMATVYRGTYEGPFNLARAVAVKVFDVLATDEDDGVLTSLTSALRRSACVRHPGVVRVDDMGYIAPAQPYAVSELVEGQTLERFASRTVRKGERIPLDLGLFIATEIAEALAGARLATSPEGVRLGLVHGELSSRDVLLSWNGEVKLTDFGVGMAARAASSVRTVSSLARRVRTFAPEVARGQAGDARSDVFSLGVLLREMLVGPRFPTSVSDAEALAWARDGVVHQGMFEPQPPAALQAILTRALERDPTRRYPHAGTLVFDLRRVALGMGVGDERAFLRTALDRVFGADRDADATSELRVPRPSGVLDRFAKLRGADGQMPTPRESGTVAVGSTDGEGDDADVEDDDGDEV
jgi:serine/threonine protein kinase